MNAMELAADIAAVDPFLPGKKWNSKQQDFVRKLRRLKFTHREIGEIVDLRHCTVQRHAAVIPTRSANDDGPIRTAREIAADVAAMRGVSIDLIYSQSRIKTASYARFEIWWLIREELGWSYFRIADAFDRLDHSTIINGVRQWQSKLDQEAALKITAE